VLRLLVTASVVPSSPIPVTLIMEALSPSETSVLTRATWRNIPEDVILHSHRCENLKSYIELAGWTLQWRRHVSPVKYEVAILLVLLEEYKPLARVGLQENVSSRLVMGHALKRICH
jgi:hypothetical protein